MKSNLNFWCIVAALVSFSHYALAQTNESKVQSAAQPSEKSSIEAQAGWKIREGEAAIQNQKNTLFCAASTYTKKDGKFVVLYEGKCEKGGFSGEPTKTNLSDRKSKF